MTGSLTMSHPIVKNPKRRSPICKIMLALGLSLGGSFYVSSSYAQWIVEDPTSIAKAIEEYAKEAERWAETQRHYIDQMQHYADQVRFWEQQLIKLQRLQFDLIKMQVNFQKRPLDYGVENTCPGSGGGIGEMVDGVLHQFIPSLSEDIPTQQRKLCQQIVVAQNYKYNATVELLDRITQYQQQVQEIETQRMSVGTSQGDLAANDNEALRFIGRTNTDLNYWRVDMAAYDQYIEDLKSQQAMLAKRAMKGSPNGWSQVVDAITLKAAFSL